MRSRNCANASIRWCCSTRRRLRKALDQSVKQGKGAGEGYWILLLELLQWQNDHRAFEDRAIEFAIAFEVSPPSWEPPLCATTGRGFDGALTSPSPRRIIPRRSSGAAR